MVDPKPVTAQPPVVRTSSNPAYQSPAVPRLAGPSVAPAGIAPAVVAAPRIPQGREVDRIHRQYAPSPSVAAHEDLHRFFSPAQPLVLDEHEPATIAMPTLASGSSIARDPVHAGATMVFDVDDIPITQRTSAVASPPVSRRDVPSTGRPQGVAQPRATARPTATAHPPTAPYTAVLPPVKAPPTARPVARPTGRTAAPTAPGGTTPTAPVTTVENIVATIRLDSTCAGLTITHNPAAGNAFSVIATKPGHDGSFRITASTVHAPVEKALRAAMQTLQPFGVKDQAMAFDIAVVFDTPEAIRDAAVLRGVRMVRGNDCVVVIDRNRDDHSRVTPGTSTHTSAGVDGNILTVGDLRSADLPLNHSRMPQIVVFVPWSAAMSRNGDNYERHVLSAIARLREALRRVLAALPSGASHGGGGRGR